MVTPASADAAHSLNVCKAVPKAQVAGALQLQITHAYSGSAGTQSICAYGNDSGDLADVLIGIRPGTRSAFRQVKRQYAHNAQGIRNQPNTTVAMHSVTGAGGPAFSFAETHAYGDGTGQAYRLVLVFRHGRLSAFSISAESVDLSVVPSISGFVRLAHGTRAEL